MAQRALSAAEVQRELENIQRQNAALLAMASTGGVPPPAAGLAGMPFLTTPLPTFNPMLGALGSLPLPAWVPTEAVSAAPPTLKSLKTRREEEKREREEKRKQRKMAGDDDADVEVQVKGAKPVPSPAPDQAGPDATNKQMSSGEAASGGEVPKEGEEGTAKKSFFVLKKNVIGAPRRKAAVRAPSRPAPVVAAAPAAKPAAEGAGELCTIAPLMHVSIRW